MVLPKVIALNVSAKLFPIEFDFFVADVLKIYFKNWIYVAYNHFIRKK